MVSITATPVPHAVFNEFDRHGLLLGLIRIAQERNPAYKQRLLDVFVKRGGSTHTGLLNAITRELGLSIIDTMTIVPLLDGNGDPLLTSPAVVFEETKCTLFSDFCNNTILLTIDRFTSDGGAYTLGELRDTINSTGFFAATLTDEAESQKKSMTIFNQSSVIEIGAEDISGNGSLIVLKNNNLIEGTVTVRSPNLVRLVAAENFLRFPGDYTIKFKEGLIVALGAATSGSFIRYSFRDDLFVAQSSPVIMHNLQSDDFRTKMFEQVCDDEGDECDGLPTVLGADIINELMSVFPANWGT